MDGLLVAAYERPCAFRSRSRGTASEPRNESRARKCASRTARPLERYGVPKREGVLPPREGSSRARKRDVTSADSAQASGEVLMFYSGQWIDRGHWRFRDLLTAQTPPHTPKNDSLKILGKISSRETREREMDVLKGGMCRARGVVGVTCACVWSARLYGYIPYRVRYGTHVGT